MTRVILCSPNSYYDETPIQYVNVCNLTPAVVIHTSNQLALLQQACYNTDVHIGGLCDMKTENIYLW